jgi:hypothetical protein
MFVPVSIFHSMKALVKPMSFGGRRRFSVGQGLFYRGVSQKAILQQNRLLTFYQL